MKYVALLVICLAAAVACVSSRAGEENLDAINQLAALAVEADPANVPAAQKAIDDAAALEAATETGAQITNLGIPDDLANANQANVEALAALVDQEDPKVQVLIAEARQQAASISGKTGAIAGLKIAAKKTPWTATALQVLELFGIAVGGAYGVTRGRKHAVNWWKTPWGEKAPDEVPDVPKA